MVWFNILDYTGSATRLFADPVFDGDPVRVTEEELAEDGTTRVVADTAEEEPTIPDETTEPDHPTREKFYYDGGQVEIAAHLVYELDPNGRQLRVVRYTDYAAESVRMLAADPRELRTTWMDAKKRQDIIARLKERGIDFEELATTADHPEADPFDLLCHLAFNAPLRTRRERAQQLKQTQKDFFEQYGPEARQVLDELLEKYAEHGDAQFVLPGVLKVPPISDHGQVTDIIRYFGGPEQLRQAVNDLQRNLYAAA